MTLRLVAIASVLAQLCNFADGAPVGAIKLDNLTFDKMVTAPGLNLLVKIDTDHAYGEKEDAFVELCKLGGPVKNLLIGSIGVQEYADKENDDLRARFEVKSEEMPVFFLFKGSAEARTKFTGFADPSAKRPANWDDDEDGAWEAPLLSEATTKNLATWLRTNGIRMPFDGTIFDLDEQVQRFMKDPKDASAVTEAKRLANDDHKEDKKAAVYVKIFDKVLANGVGYIEKELTRVQKILAGQITPEKAAELGDKVAILNVFAAKHD